MLSPSFGKTHTYPFLSPPYPHPTSLHTDGLLPLCAERVVIPSLTPLSLSSLSQSPILHPLTLIYHIIYMLLLLLYPLICICTACRETAGPWDVDIAKEIRPQSIRGKFGENNVRSAVHCTDLPTDGVSDCEYCFRIMQQQE